MSNSCTIGTEYDDWSDMFWGRIEKNATSPIPVKCTECNKVFSPGEEFCIRYGEELDENDKVIREEGTPMCSVCCEISAYVMGSYVLGSMWEEISYAFEDGLDFPLGMADVLSKEAFLSLMEAAEEADRHEKASKNVEE